MILTELCQILRNWFDRGKEKWHGKITIDDGDITVVTKSGEPFALQDGQYFRIIGSLFNDGVHKYGDAEDVLTDETFEGSIWSMAVPPAVVALAAEIDEWIAKYGTIDSQAMSPFNSESFGGYSYSKSAGGSASGSGTGNPASWQAVYASRLNQWRKI